MKSSSKATLLLPLLKPHENKHKNRYLTGVKK